MSTAISTTVRSKAVGSKRQSVTVRDGPNKRPRKTLAAPLGKSIIFDVETTGLPVRDGKGRFLPDYWQHSAYDGARLVSVAWRVIGPAPEMELIKDEYRVVCPDGFDIHKEATPIHGISHQDAVRHGVAIGDVLTDLINDMATCNVIVAHNAQFDMRILRSELSRFGRKADISTTFSKGLVCTMFEGRDVYKLSKLPKLAELLEKVTGRQLIDAHDARADVDACASCYIEMVKRLTAIIAPPSSSTSSNDYSKPSNST